MPLGPINKSNPVNLRSRLNKGCVAWWLGVPGLAGSSRFPDLLGRFHGTLVNSTAWAPARNFGADVQELKLNGTSGYVDCGNSALLNPIGEVSYCAKVRVIAAASQVWFLARDDNTLGRSFALGMNTTQFILQVQGSPLFSVAPTPTFAPNTDYYVVATLSASANTSALYANGVPLATGTYSAPASATGSTTLGERTYAGNNGFLSGWPIEGRIYNRALSAGEVLELYTDSLTGYPATLNRVGTRLPASAPAAYTLTTAPGAFVVTGNAAGLYLGHRLATAPGAFVVADPGSGGGSVVNLIVARKLPTAAGAFATAGQVATIVVVHDSLITAPGAFVLTGGAATLAAARTLPAAPAAFVVSGNAAGLSAGHTFATAPGAFVLTGIAAAFGLARGLGTAPGAFVVTGNAAGLVAARILTATPGAFLLTGNPAGLTATAAYLLTAAAGAFVLTGNAAAIAVARRLTTAPGAFILTGNAAVFTITGGLPTDLLNAVQLLYDGSSAAGPGGTIYLTIASRRTPMPFVCVDLASAPLAFTSSTSKIRKVRLRFRVYAGSAEAAGPIADLLEDGFKGQRLVFTGGFTGPLVIGDRGPRKDAGLSNPGSEVWYELVEFSVMVKRN